MYQPLDGATRNDCEFGEDIVTLITISDLLTGLRSYFPKAEKQLWRESAAKCISKYSTSRGRDFRELLDRERNPFAAIAFCSLRRAYRPRGGCHDAARVLVSPPPARTSHRSVFGNALRSRGGGA